MGRQLSGAPSTRHMASENQHPWVSGVLFLFFVFLRTRASVLLNSLDWHMAHKKLCTSDLESLKTFRKLYVKFIH